MAADKAPLPQPPEHYRRFAQRYPDVAAAEEALGQRVREAGPLSERDILLVKLAIAIGARTEGGTHAHVRKALAADVEPEVLRQIALLAGPTIGWPNAMAALAWVEDLLGE